MDEKNENRKTRYGINTVNTFIAPPEEILDTEEVELTEDEFKEKVREISEFNMSAYNATRLEDNPMSYIKKVLVIL